MYMWGVLLFAIPFGTALQSIFLTVAIALLLWRSDRPKIQDRLVRVTVVMLAWIVWNSLVSVIQGAVQLADGVGFAFGYVGIAILPVLALRVPTLDPIKWTRRSISLGLCLWAMVALTQSIWGWSLESFPIGEQFRPLGFYSHPLTFAYVALLCWPLFLWSTGQLQGSNDQRSSKTLAWLGTAMLAVIVLLTQSRTVQLVCFCATLAYLVVCLPIRWRAIAVATTLGLGLLIVSTPNPVGNRFQAVFAEDSPDRFSNYPDDRVAFWHAHWLMFQERPWTGHGIKIDRALREPYYERLGLKDFERPYEAHNMFLQTLAEGGILSLVLFMAWIILLFQVVPISSPFFFPYTTLLACFVAGGLTQNAFQDAEVRYSMAVLLSLVIANQHKLERKLANQ